MGLDVARPGIEPESHSGVRPYTQTTTWAVFRLGCAIFRNGAYEITVYHLESIDTMG